MGIPNKRLRKMPHCKHFARWGGHLMDDKELNTIDYIIGSQSQSLLVTCEYSRAAIAARFMPAEIMATHARADPSQSFGILPLSSYNESNPIDLTLDDDDDSALDNALQHLSKRQRTDSSPISQSDIISNTHFISHNGGIHSPSIPFLNFVNERSASNIPQSNSFLFPRPPGIHQQSQPSTPSTPYHPNFAGSSPATFGGSHMQSTPGALTPTLMSPLSGEPSIFSPPERQIIDLTGSSPSPPPIQLVQHVLPNDMPPKAPVCIGLLTVTALVLYSVPHLHSIDPNSNGAEWAHVRLQYEYNPNKSGGPHIIHIKVPPGRTPNSDITGEESFAVVEQKVSTALGPMLGKGLIKLDAKVRRGLGHLPILPLLMLVYTPKGNIPIVGGYLHAQGLLLDHPTSQHPFQRPAEVPYFNPHNPPPGGHNRALINADRVGSLPSVNNVDRWTMPVSGKSVEVQRSQVEELFRSLKSGDEVPETEPPLEVATTLYSHQKKGLTFLLERERERPGPDGTYSSLWQMRLNKHTRTWYHIVTQKEILTEPPQCKGAILADDMGLGKTITCVSLIAATLDSARAFASTPLDPILPRPERASSEPTLTAAHFSGTAWGMPDVSDTSHTSAKAKAKAARGQDKLETEFIRASRIKVKSRATLIICPLSTVANWEDQFREHWHGSVTVVGGSGGTTVSSQSLHSQSFTRSNLESESNTLQPKPLRVYVYHGNARRPDPDFLADFDAVITTYATLASEFSKQSRSLVNLEGDEEEEDGSSDGGILEIDERGNPAQRVFKAKKAGVKRKKVSALLNLGAVECTSPLQSVHWFRVVLDEAHAIKETGTVGSRACCDLMADRRLCLTGTPVQNKLDDVYALIKFLRLHPFHDKNVWTEFIGTPVKYGHALGVARLQTIMKCITLRRTKESRSQDGKKILSLPPRRDELRYLKFDEQEQEIYNGFYNESKAEFKELSSNNEVMKNYVGILQKILRLRQICDHFELVEQKRSSADGALRDLVASYEDTVAAITREGINPTRAFTIFALLRESATTQCVECGTELCNTGDTNEGANSTDLDSSMVAKRSRKTKNSSHVSTRANSPNQMHPILTRCQHLFCLDCYRLSIYPGWPNVPPDTRRLCSACQTELSPSDAVEVKPDQNPEINQRKKLVKREKRQKGLPLDNFRPSTKVKALLGDLIQSSKANPHSANYDSESVEFQMVDDRGNDVGDNIVKTVVFSQWTSMLDKIEDALEVANIRYDRLDGTMKREERSRAIDALKHDPGCEVLLVSLKAGGVGLNLTAAQRVYLMDPYWNPAVENQAVDRIHRLGQTRPVATIRLIIENSIEARLLEVQKKKTELANMTLGHSFSKAEMLQRRLEELNQLFG